MSCVPANKRTIYIGNDNEVLFGPVEDGTGEYVSTATVTFTLKNSDGDAFSWATNVLMPPVTGSNGMYRGIIDGTAMLLPTDDSDLLSDGEECSLVFSANVSGDDETVITVQCQAATRTL